MSRVIRKKNKVVPKEIKPTLIKHITPDPQQVIAKLDTEETTWVIVFKDDSTVVLLALDGSYETISIPVTQFNRSKYTFEADDGKTYTANIKLYIQA